RNPDLQADMARTIDHISARGGVGRFIFGTGAGWFQRDYDEYGFPFGTAGSRLNDLRDALPRIQRRWSVLNPPPTRNIPVMIGGSGEQKTLRLVARHADIWHSFTGPDAIGHKFEVLRRWADREERDLSTLTVSSELARRDEDAADALFAAGARMFTLGLTGPDYDPAAVSRWLAWRDRKNA
ncbi:LLM class flavin-dependent oxidoreductase, partial [Microbacterium sp.]|uniref:LLM class flavin-dependent oxidoreductase n=1 Tax=Microbacterium sp. TaxID=51671 RepID=UPI003A84A1E5